MEKLKGQEIKINGLEGSIHLNRNEYGVPLVRADNFIDLFYGLGWVHAFDRPVELELTRLLAKGTAAENLVVSNEMISSDTYMRRFNLAGDGRDQVTHLTDEAARIAESYCAGINHVLSEGGRPFEFKLIRHKPDPWTAADCIMMTKFIGLIDMTESQAGVEKLIVQMIQNNVSLEQLRELFPYMTDKLDPAFLEVIKRVKLFDPIVPQTLRWKTFPRMNASNNWAVSGTRTVSGKPILCGDPHLDSSRLPAIWHEVRLRSNDVWFVGCTIPGIPLPALGRTKSIAWSPTYGNMDVIDFFVEEVKNGRYRRGEEWRDFKVREEVIKLKKGEPRRVLFYENEHGTIEGDPSKEDGYYLSMAFTLGRGCGADTLNHGAVLLTLKTVKDLMPHFAALDFCSMNWVCADSQGNIGLHQSGKCPVRAEGVSGLLPVPGWDQAFDWKGTYSVDNNPSLFNPPEGYIGTANQDLNYCAKTRVYNLPSSGWRARRIHQLLGERKDHTVSSMQKMQYDLYSKHAEDWMTKIKPLLPEGNAANLLREWDLSYKSDSLAASIFENIYLELIRMVFGKQSLGEQVVSYLMEETALFLGNLIDKVMLKDESLWFGGRARDELLKEVIKRGLAKEARPWGEGRKVLMKNIMFGGKLPKWLGFDYGPIEIKGNRATIPQGQIFKTFGGRHGTFSPTYKFITDFSEECIHSAMAGGPSDRRFSRWYTSGVPDWLAGRYRVMSPVL